MRCSRLTKSRTPRPTASGSETSNGTRCDVPAYFCPISSLTACACETELRKLIPTIAPSRAHASAMARPMPRLAPVTTMRLPASIARISDDDGGIVTTEAVRGGKHVPLIAATRSGGHVVEIAFGVRLREVDGRMHPAPLHACDGGDGLHGSSSRDEMTDHRFGRRNRHGACAIPEQAFDGE